MELIISSIFFSIIVGMPVMIMYGLYKTFSKNIKDSNNG